MRKENLNGIRTHNLCDAGTVLYQLSFQDNWTWELAIYEFVIAHFEKE